MTVAELIAKLQEMPPDALVVRESHYGGLDGIDEAEAIKIAVYESSVGDSHGDYCEWQRWMEGPPDGEAVVIR